MKTLQSVFFILAILALVAFSGCTTSAYYGVSYTYGTSWDHYYDDHYHHHRPPPPAGKPRPPHKPGPPHNPGHNPPGMIPKPKPH